MESKEMHNNQLGTESMKGIGTPPVINFQMD